MMQQKRAYNGDFGRQCPVCGDGRLSCPTGKTNSDKSVLFRKRTCGSCGIEVEDTIVKKREILPSPHTLRCSG